tara:strand:- start:71 stop:316 length:246 start_codon:yes stop_codon:yes gene_type:complete
MKKVIVNRIKLVCSKGRIEKGDTVILPDDEVARIIAGRPDVITVLGDVREPAPVIVAKPEAKVETKPKSRKPRNAKSRTLN